MGVSLTDLINDKRVIAVEYLGRTVTLNYRPHSLNRSFYQEQRERVEERRKENQVMTDDEWACFWFQKIVCGWDLTDGKSEAPINEDTLSLLGTQFLLSAISDISSDLLPNQRNAADSQDGSPPTD